MRLLERVTRGEATITSVRSEEDTRGLSLLYFRRAAALGVLAVAAALAACGDTSASTAPLESVVETTSPASVTSVSGAAGRDVGVDAGTVWDEVFGVLSPSEMSCIRDEVDGDVLALVREWPVVPEFRAPEQWEVLIFSCLDPQAARGLFHSVIVMRMEEELDLELSGDQESCVREWVAGLDVGAALAALADSGFSYGDYRNSMAARIVWEGTSSESYYVEVGFPGGTSSYPLTFFVSDTIDEQPCWIGEAKAATIGESVQGVVDYEGDSDLFVFEAEEGTLYEIDVAWGVMSEPVAAVSLGDGWKIVSDDSEDFGSAARIVWEASRSGSHYIDAGSFEEGGTGSYTLTIVVSDIIDDHSGSEATAVTIGEPVLGTVDYEGDFDVFVLEAEERRLYEIDVSLGTWLYATQVVVYDAYFSKLAYNSECGDPPGSCLVWEAPRSGRYYVEVGDGSGAGSYTLTIDILDVVDDHSGSEATAVMIGEPVLGAVDYWDDFDVFVFEAVAGRLYEIDVALGTLSDSFVEVYDDSDYSGLAYNDDCGDSSGSCLVWEAPSSGSYYVYVDSSEIGGTGSYTLTIDISDVSDDHSDSPSGATAVTIGEPVLGTVDDWDDYDFFVFEAVAGRLYEIDVALGTLPDAFVDVYDADYSELALSDACGNSPVPCVLWEAPSSGRYYVEVGAQSGAGSYTLTIHAL